MKLRYIYLPDYGPLQDIAVIFGQNTHIKDRRGSVNFVVGLNGSGKSSLLRAVFDIFQSLSDERLPGFPVSMAYDIEGVGTVFLHRPRGASSDSFLTVRPHETGFRTTDEWQEYILKDLPPRDPRDPSVVYIEGDQLKGNGNLRQWLPSRVLAYTTGDPSLWENLTFPTFTSSDLPSSPPLPSDERPPRWSSDQARSLAPDSNEVRFTHARSDESGSGTQRCILLRPDDAKLAAVALGILQAAIELEPRNETAQQAAFRSRVLEQIQSKRMVEEPVRRVLNELDWLWPTHLALHMTDHVSNVHHPDVAKCYWLLALADTVLAYPLDETLVATSLDHGPPVRPEELVGEAPGGILDLMGEPMRGAQCKAEALRRLLGEGAPEASQSLWPMFSFFHNLRINGILKDADLIVKRIHPLANEEGQVDDRVQAYSSLSDGERMLLGRVAFLFLLKEQPNSLLLLDEPETHFNDAWKRQIIDLIDDGILKDTSVHVLVSTHTSLALTDVFSSEITRLVNEHGVTRAETLVFPTFGADPGRILLHVFGAPDVIGQRAAEFLRQKLQETWTKDDQQELESLIEEIGSGWPRAKLMEIHENLEAVDAAPGS